MQVCVTGLCGINLEQQFLAHPGSQVVLIVLQVRIAAHQRQSSPSRRPTALPQGSEHATGIDGELMRAYCCLKLRHEPIMAQPLVGWDKA